MAEVSCGTQNKKLKDLLEASIQPPVANEMRDGFCGGHYAASRSWRPARIPKVAEKVQENVKSAVQNMTSVTVSRVNLVIVGLAHPGQ